MTTVGPVASLPKLRRPGRASRVIIAVALAVGVTLAGLGTYDYVQSQFGGTTLVVLTYPSLFGGNCGGNPPPPAFSTAFGTFASEHDVRVEVECPPGTAYAWLANARGSASADVVVGLDEITAPEAAAAGLLVPYAPPSVADVPSELVSELAPNDSGIPTAVPYEYGYLAIDYNASFNASTRGAVMHLTFPDVVRNASWAHALLVEDPASDITGEEFLVWQVEYYEHVLHQNWTTFWSGMPAGAPPYADDWGDAYAEFGEGLYPMVVSYSTDPAYAAYYNESGTFNSTVSWWNGTAYGWRSIYGIGIAAGTRHLALAEAFEQWFLSGTVQSEIPENEWEYPANETVALPGVFQASISPSSIVPLNNDTTPEAVGSSIAGWVNTWELLTS